jgi:chromosome segregation ATPase
MKDEQKETPKKVTAEEVLKGSISFRGSISNGNFTCVGVPYADALKAMESFAQPLREDIIKVQNNALDLSATIQCKDNEIAELTAYHEDLKEEFFIQNQVIEGCNDEIERMKGENIEWVKDNLTAAAHIQELKDELAKPVETGEEKVSTYDELNMMYQELLSAYGAMNKINGELMAEIKELEHSLPSTRGRQKKKY